MSEYRPKQQEMTNETAIKKYLEDMEKHGTFTKEDLITYWMLEATIGNSITFYTHGISGLDAHTVSIQAMLEELTK